MKFLGESGHNGSVVTPLEVLGLNHDPPDVQVRTTSGCDNTEGSAWVSGASASHARAKSKWMNLVTGKSTKSNDDVSNSGNATVLPLLQVRAESGGSPMARHQRLHVTSAHEETTLNTRASSTAQHLHAGDATSRRDGAITAREIELNVGDVTPTGSLSLREQQMLASLHDIRLELRDEAEAIAQRMGRIDERIKRIVMAIHTPPMTSRVSSTNSAASAQSSATIVVSPDASVTSATTDNVLDATKAEVSSEKSASVKRKLKKRDSKSSDKRASSSAQKSSEGGSGRESVSSRSDTPPSRAASRSASAKIKRSRVAPHDVSTPASTASTSSVGIGEGDISSGDLSIPTTPTQPVTSEHVDDDEQVPLPKRDLDLM